MTKTIDLAQLLRESNAVLTGHFVLSSGRHSAVYIEKFRVLEEPPVLSALCAELATKCKDLGAEFVAGPLTGGIIIAFEVARQMGLPARYIENENGLKTFRRQATLPPGAKVLVVDDVLTTGLSLQESREAVERASGSVVGFAVLIDRSQNHDLSAPLFSGYRVSAESYAEDKIPDWLAAIPVTKPGTRA